MVVVRRKSTFAAGFPVSVGKSKPTRLPESAGLRRAITIATSVPYGGDGRTSPTGYTWLATSPSWESSPTNNDLTLKNDSGRYSSSVYFSFTKQTKVKEWLGNNYTSNPSRGKKYFRKAMVVATVVSWILAWRQYRPSRELITNFQDKLQTYQMYLSQTADSIAQMEEKIGEETHSMQQLLKVRDAMAHELKVYAELSESEIGINVSPESQSSPELVNRWLQHRQVGLGKKLDMLQQSIQKLSRETVLEKYGPGPHRLRFTVEVPKGSTSKRSGWILSLPNGENMERKSFVVELAPLDLMPHSVHFFMDMVQAKLWDETIFSHQYEAEHIIAAAPVNFKTRAMKPQLRTLGWTGLGWPEYSSEYPHLQYTLGFATAGPTFYINTIDNVDVHGPGSQPHHKLPHDADPCFGRVVEGTEVVDAMVKLDPMKIEGSLMDEQGETQLDDWDNERKYWTHLVSVEMI